MTSFDTGRRAEAAAAEFLSGEGYKILEQNYRTRWCEIDVVAEKAGTVSFAEVKYRASAAQGNGLEYITSKKLVQMRFAAEFWVAEHNFAGDYQLAAIEVSGQKFQITNFIDSIT
jgi:uncharacterized protein (TIGR00252 family)